MSHISLASNLNLLRALVNEISTSIQKSISRHIGVLIFAVSLLLLPAAMVWLFAGRNFLDGYDDTHAHKQNDQVTELLQGELLVPPAPLPPEMFVTEEVLQIRPALVDASRDWQLLDSDFSQRILLVFKIMKERYGYDMAMLEGYRSPQRQNKLASMGSSVTNAGAFQSYHQFGLAADCAFSRDGKLIISEKDPWAMRGYQLYGEVAESLGLRWGGRWKMMDLGHIELRKAGVIGLNRH
ncbi:MAG: M15 family metallopeptidase [Sulfuriferula sp.]|nr:M15 family metallopeptidase [Sulfuriferula sp.]